MTKALGCCNPMEGGMLVGVCLHGILEEYHIFLESLSSSSFFKVMEVARGTNESVHGASQPSSTGWSNLVSCPRPCPAKGPSSGPLRNAKIQVIGFKEIDPKQKRTRQLLALPPFPYEPKKAMVPLDKWVKNRAIILPEVYRLHLVNTRRTRCIALTIEIGACCRAMISIQKGY